MFQLALCASFEYLWYGSTTFRNTCSLQSDVCRPVDDRFWSLKAPPVLKGLTWCLLITYLCCSTHIYGLKHISNPTRFYICTAKMKVFTFQGHDGRLLGYIPSTTVKITMKIAECKQGPSVFRKKCEKRWILASIKHLRRQIVEE